MQSDDAIYDYQLYQIIRWFYKDDIEDDDVLQLVRKWVADRNRSFWLRSYALTYLGRFGDDADLEGIEQGYGEVASDIERADRIAALSRMEKSRRNGFYARVLRDGHYVERADWYEHMNVPLGSLAFGCGLPDTWNSYVRSTSCLMREKTLRRTSHELRNRIYLY